MVFEGFNKDKKDQYNLFKIKYSRNGYYSCRLVHEFDLDKVSKEWDSFLEENY